MIGFLLSQNEFNEVVEWAHEHALDDDLRNQIFLWTGGHTGAVVDILHLIKTAIGFSNFIKISEFFKFLFGNQA